MKLAQCTCHKEEDSGTFQHLKEKMDISCRHYTYQRHIELARNMEITKSERKLKMPGETIQSLQMVNDDNYRHSPVGRILRMYSKSCV